MLCLWWNEKSSHSATAQEFAIFKQDMQIKADAQALENSQKALKAAKEIQDAQLTHATQLEKLKNDYDKRNKTHINTIANLRNKLRDQLRADTFTSTEVETDTTRTAEEWAINYANLARKHNTLTHACAITTADYNLLRDWADAACNQIGCEP